MLAQPKPHPNPPLPLHPPQLPVLRPLEQRPPRRVRFASERQRAIRKSQRRKRKKKRKPKRTKLPHRAKLRRTRLLQMQRGKQRRMLPQLPSPTRTRSRKQRPPQPLQPRRRKRTQQLRRKQLQQQQRRRSKPTPPPLISPVLLWKPKPARTKQKPLRPRRLRRMLRRLQRPNGKRIAHRLRSARMQRRKPRLPSAKRPLMRRSKLKPNSRSSRWPRRANAMQLQRRNVEQLEPATKIGKPSAAPPRTLDARSASRPPVLTSLRVVKRNCDGLRKLLQAPRHLV